MISDYPRSFANRAELPCHSALQSHLSLLHLNVRRELNRILFRRMGGLCQVLLRQLAPFTQATLAIVRHGLYRFNASLKQFGGLG